MFDGHLRNGVDQMVRPVGRGLRDLGVTADHLTLIGVSLSVATAVAIGAGALQLGLLLLILSALPDLLDGAVAKAAGTSSRRGAFFDSTADRITDAFLLGGIAWYLSVEEGGQWFMLPVAVLGVSSLISYMRAKAESLGFDAKGGLMERAERIIVLCVGLLFESILIPILWIMLVLTSITAVQRFIKVWRQASDEVAVPPRVAERRRRRQVRVEKLNARVQRREERRRVRRAGTRRDV